MGIFGLSALTANAKGNTAFERLASRSAIEASNSGMGKQRACQAHQDAIKMHTLQMTKMTSNMLSKFNSISSRTQDFYTSKVLPTGGSVSNYNNLLTDIQSKKTAVDTALQTASSSASNFSCDNPDPKGAITSFKNNMHAVTMALKDYRTSIRALIVAVHQAIVGNEASGSAHPKGSSIGE